MGEEKPPRARWSDWWPLGWPDPKVITRAQLLDQLAERGVPVDERLLRHWEQRGALPRAVRRSHAGQVQAVYPVWMADLVGAVHAWRDSRPLHRIVPLARTFFVDFARSYEQPDPPAWTDPGPPEYVRAALTRYLQETAVKGGEVAIELRPNDGATQQWSVSWSGQSGPRGPLNTPTDKNEV